MDGLNELKESPEPRRRIRQLLFRINNNTTNNSPRNMMMPNFSLLSHSVRMMSTRASNIMFAQVLLMATRNFMQHTKRFRANLVLLC
ncbi:LOW QUALITY PROTEIN: hypothetical protein TorRG33x02_084800 [Trema orientale]|uniref:Uncharacterized protein n=1 Tax=Trema orientale TaxID=63057 RepID=A0A2P5FCX7_TREOI|nr:LOW QUALITY PROTEIN: hypothetical protein TorRG33x02_084800 [Trema orientale]